MKKFKVAFITAFFAFTAFYIFAVVKNAHNPFGKLIGVESETEKPTDENINSSEEKEIDLEKMKKPKEEFKGEITFLVMGIDGMDLTTEEAKHQRTDTMILTRINFETGEVRMLNLPRDTQYKFPNGNYVKLNAGHATGGSELAMKYINNLTGLQVENYAKVDYMAVKKLVDSIGGVEFEIPFRMKYLDTTKGKELSIDFKPGLQTLNGQQAIEFLRWRKNSPGIPMPTDGSDISRIEHQQQFLKAVISQALSFKNVFKLPKILRVVLPNVETNIPIETILKMATSAGKIDTENIKTMTLPGHAENDAEGISYWIMNKAEADNLINENFR